MGWTKLGGIDLIDEKILDREPPIPLLAIVLNQLTSSQTIRAVLVIFSTATMLIMLLQGREVPDAVSAILFVVIGYYFGEAVPRPTRDK